MGYGKIVSYETTGVNCKKGQGKMGQIKKRQG